MFIKTQRKPLKYMMMSRSPGGEWLTGSTLTSWNKAHEYAMNTSNNGLDCAMIVTRGGQFEYEKRYYAISDTERYLLNRRETTNE